MPRPSISQAQAERPEGLLASIVAGQYPDGSALVLRTTAGSVDAGQTAKQYIGKVATSITAAVAVPLETVTAGKTFLITDIIVNTDATALLDVRIQAAGADIFRCACRDLAPVQFPGIETQPFATSGQAVTILLPVTTVSQQVWFDILGIEQ